MLPELPVTEALPALRAALSERSNAVLIAPNPITRDNLNDVIDGGWVTKEEVCAGVAAGSGAGAGGSPSSSIRSDIWVCLWRSWCHFRRQGKRGEER